MYGTLHIDALTLGLGTYCTNITAAAKLIRMQGTMLKLTTSLGSGHICGGSYAQNG